METTGSYIIQGQVSCHHTVPSTEGLRSRHRCLSKKGTHCGLCKLNFCSQSCIYLSIRNPAFIEVGCLYFWRWIKSTQLVLSLWGALASQGVSFKEMFIQKQQTVFKTDRHFPRHMNLNATTPKIRQTVLAICLSRLLREQAHTTCNTTVRRAAPSSRSPPHACWHVASDDPLAWKRS